MHQFVAYTEAELNEEMRYDKEPPDGPYPQLTIPDKLQDMREIVFDVTSHNQGKRIFIVADSTRKSLANKTSGWSIYEHSHGTYRHSFSFFLVDIPSHSQASLLPRRCPSNNVPAGNQWHINRQV